MKRFDRFLHVTAHQILSILLLAFIVYVFAVGFMTMVKNPPDTLVIIGVMGFGFLMGVLEFFTDDKLPKKPSSVEEKDDLED